MKRKIGFLFGGCSSEYAVSLQSAAAVIRHLDMDRFEPVLIGITRQGHWFRYQGAVEKIVDDTWWSDKSCIPAVISPSREVHGVLEFHGESVKQIFMDVVFPIMHGKNGEDGTIQGLLELSGIPFIGCGTLSSALCMDKELAHMIAEAVGISIPSFVTLRRYEDIQAKVEQAELLGYPLFVKPARAGSSFGITKAADRKQLLNAIEQAFQHDTKVVIEESIDGFEVGCAVLGNDDVLVGAVDEIELQEGFFDYTEKYTLNTSKIHTPARISQEKAREIKETALVLYKALECRGFARVDMFLTSAGDIVFNEINTIPGFTAHSRYPNMLKAVGMSFEEVIDRLIGLVIEDENKGGIHFCGSEEEGSIRY